MTQKEVIGQLSDILSKSGMDSAISISNNTNEIADIMVYQEPKRQEYLSLNNKPLFPFEAIVNILYKNGPDDNSRFEDTQLTICFLLKYKCEYIVEYGNSCFHGYMICDKSQSDHELQGTDIAESYLEKCNEISRTAHNLSDVLDDFAGTLEVAYVDNSEAAEIGKTVFSFLENNPSEIDLLLHFAYISLEIYVYDDDDVFGIKDIFAKLIQINAENSFLEYIQKEDLGVEGYSLSLSIAALRLFNEAKN